jgi:hypothetical protein
MDRDALEALLEHKEVEAVVAAVGTTVAERSALRHLPEEPYPFCGRGTERGKASISPLSIGGGKSRVSSPI